MAETRSNSEDRVTHFIHIFIGVCLVLLSPFILIVLFDLTVGVLSVVPGAIGIVLGVATVTSMIAAVIALITLKGHYTGRRRRIHLLIAVNGAFWLLAAIASAALYSLTSSV